MMQIGIGLGILMSAGRRVASTVPVISITAGGGYAGSVYTSTIAGQWTADDVDISGETGATFTMTTALEGAAIKCGASNSIEMWTFADIPGASKTNGGWWDPKISWTVSADKVTSVSDQFGVRAMSQDTGSQQPAESTIDSFRAMVWPDTGNNVFIGPAASFSPAFFMMVMRYRDGSASTFAAYDTFASDASSTNRVIGSIGSANMFAVSVWASLVRKNGNTASALSVLPLTKSVVSFSGTPASALWGIGRSNNAAVDRGWKGPIFEVLALGENPTGDLLDRIEAVAAWRNGLIGSLNASNPYKTEAPRVTS